MTRVVVVVLLACALCSCGSGQSERPPAGELAVVGTQRIMQSDVTRYAEYALSFYAWAYGTDIGSSRATCSPASRDATCARVRRQAFLRLIEERMIARYADSHHIALGRADRTRIAGQVTGLITHDTTASQLLAQHKIGSAFIQVLLEREALVRKVEEVIGLKRASQGQAYHLRQYTVPRLLGPEDAKVRRAALDLATDGTPVPDTATVRTSWVAPFRLAPKVASALALVKPGQFVGPFTRTNYYLVVEYLGRGVHRYGRPARLALETRYFRQWLAGQVRSAHLQCFDGSGRAVTCPSPLH